MEALIQELAKFIAERVDGDVNEIKDEIEYELSLLIDKKEKENLDDAECVCCNHHFSTDDMILYENNWFCEVCFDGEEEEEEEQEDPVELFSCVKEKQ